MNYDLLKSIGLGSFDITYIFIAIFALILILLILNIVQAVKLKKNDE